METLVLLWFGCAILCWFVANNKGRFAGAWFLIGLVLGPFAIVAVGLMSSRTRPTDGPSPSTHVKCPDCREFILKEAKVCKHCSCKLIPQS